jgi:hypothetical protein
MADTLRQPTIGPEGRVVAFLGSVGALVAWSSPEGPILASGGGDRTIQRWNATTGDPVGDPMTGHTDWVRALAAWSGPEGLMLASGGGGDQRIRRWNATTGDPVGDPMTGHTRPRRKRSWKERPAWVRHSFYWAVAVIAIAITAFDTNTAPASDDTNKVLLFVCFVFLVVLVGRVAIKRLASLLREQEQVGVARTISRSLVVFTCLLGFTAVALVELRRWGLHVEACRTVGELETCQGPASARQILGMLAWHAANAVPVLDITHSLEWPAPPALLIPSSGRASSFSACGLR